MNLKSQPFLALIPFWLAVATSAAAEIRVVCPPDAAPRERLAALEIVRYVYLRTGQLPVLRQLPATSGETIALERNPSQLGPQEFTIQTRGQRITITGGGDLGVLYGAYRFAELLGVRFYLHGDVIPDERLTAWPEVNETGKPLFAIRGVNPWGWHPFGFDAWSADDYKAIFAQLAKMRMNFLGIHCYPEGHPRAEPTVWHGLAGDFDAEGRVKSSYVSRYFNTLLTSAWGDYLPTKTGDYSFGGALLFERDDWAPPVMAGHCPLPQTPEACNEVFNRMAAQFRDAFSFARQLGVKTCAGTEAPLTLPKALAQRTSDVRAVYEGTFRRIMASHPLDYYWLWTPEAWTWEGNPPQQYSNTVADLKLAIEAHQNVRAPFQLATAGWVLGPTHDRAAFAADLPKDIALSALSRNTGATEVEPAFARISGREKWAIPWLESDNRNGLAALQLEAGRMRRDAADALRYGCTGLLGLHWRTDILAPNAAALAQAAWDQDWNINRIDRSWRVAGQRASFPGVRIAGTTEEELYQTCRYDLGQIQLPAPNGPYKVTLKFCEPFFKAANERVCDVKLQGATVLTNLDIFARTGQFAALDFTFNQVVVTNGMLTIELIARKSLPCISAIAVESTGFTSKLNCAGDAFLDYQADTDSPRSLPCGDFYADWARSNFGLEDIGRIFATLDGRVPQATDGGCPSGSLTPVATPWNTISRQYAFVDDMEKLPPRVRGAGNLDRFSYWLNTFKYHRSLARLRCALAKPDANELASLWSETCRYLLATVNTPGGLAMVVNLENHPGWGPAIAKHLQQPWPKAYQGEPRLIVPTVRSVVNQGESLALPIIALASQPVKALTVSCRSLGTGDWTVIPATHLARAVYTAQLPPVREAMEYYIAAETATGQKLRWPATAPTLNQTIVALP